MALFDKKRKPEDDLGAPMIGGGLQSVPAGKSEGPTQEFGIDKAIELMRKLPSDNVELVVNVVKTTLESIRVKVSTIIADAERKEAKLEDRVMTLKREIVDLESEIATRKTQIDALEADHAETRSVKERLQLADRMGAAQMSDAGAPKTPPPLPSGNESGPVFTFPTTGR
jgi:hypothetical protein